MIEREPVPRRCSACKRPGCRRDRATCPGPPAGAVGLLAEIAHATGASIDPDDVAAWQAAADAVTGDRIAEAAALRARIDALDAEAAEWERLRADLYSHVLANHVEAAVLRERLAQTRGHRRFDADRK